MDPGPDGVVRRDGPSRLLIVVALVVLAAVVLVAVGGDDDGGSADRDPTTTLAARSTPVPPSTRVPPSTAVAPTTLAPPVTAPGYGPCQPTVVAGAEELVLVVLRQDQRSFDAVPAAAVDVVPLDGGRCGHTDLAPLASAFREPTLRGDVAHPQVRLVGVDGRAVLSTGDANLQVLGPPDPGLLAPLADGRLAGGWAVDLEAVADGRARGAQVVAVCPLDEVDCAGLRLVVVEGLPRLGTPLAVGDGVVHVHSPEIGSLFAVDLDSGAARLVAAGVDPFAVAGGRALVVGCDAEAVCGPRSVDLATGDVTVLAGAGADAGGGHRHDVATADAAGLVLAGTELYDLGTGAVRDLGPELGLAPPIDVALTADGSTAGFLGSGIVTIVDLATGGRPAIARVPADAVEIAVIADP